MIEFWNYYDGPLDGVYELDGQKYFFSLSDESDLYVSLEDGGRRFDLWKVDEFPGEPEMSTTGWTPDRDPDGSVTEEELYTIERNCEK